MALMRKSTSTSFVATTFSISVTYSVSSRLRLLDTTGETDLDVECEVGDTTDNSGVLNCKDSSGITPLKIDLNDDNVGGIPDDAEIQTNPSPDLSKKSNLETIDSLPVVTVTNLTSNNCSSNGSYVITATSDKELNFTSKSNITIPFSSPDSEGLCTITVTDKTKLTMNCENTQAFSASELIISSQVINGEDDKTPLFRIEDYTAPVQFACAISDRSLKVAFPANYTRKCQILQKWIFKRIRWRCYCWNCHCYCCRYCYCWCCDCPCQEGSSRWSCSCFFQLCY